MTSIQSIHHHDNDQDHHHRYAIILIILIIIIIIIIIDFASLRFALICFDLLESVKENLEIISSSS